MKYLFALLALWLTNARAQSDSVVYYVTMSSSNYNQSANISWEYPPIEFNFSDSFSRAHENSGISEVKATVSFDLNGNCKPANVRVTFVQQPGFNSLMKNELRKQILAWFKNLNHYTYLNDKPQPDCSMAVLVMPHFDFQINIWLE